jgi:hypothetical protein
MAAQARRATFSVLHTSDASIGSIVLLDAHACPREVCPALPDDDGAGFFSFDSTGSDFVALLPDFGGSTNSGHDAEGSNQHIRGSGIAVDGGFPT